MAVPYHTHTFEVPTATKEETAETSISNKVVVPSSLGTAAVEDASAFATAAQGALADTAVQPADLDTAIDGVVDDAVEQATAGAEAAAAAAAGTYANIVGALAASLSIKLNTTLVTGQTDYPLTSLIPVSAPEMAYVYIGSGAWLLPDIDYQIVAGGTYNTLRLASAPTSDLNGVSLVVRGAFSATTEALDNSVFGIVFQTLSSMKAATPVPGQVAHLNVAGREGTFKWTDANLSAFVTADPASGCYIKADTIAANLGAWVRQGGWAAHGVDAEWFGVVPNLSSAAAANATALQRALNLLDITTYAGKLNLPLGRTFYNPAGLTIPCILQTRPHAICGSQPGAMPNVDLYEIQDDGTLFVAGSALTLYGDGTSAKRVWTRREYRGSSSDPQDTARSVGWNCQALGARFEHVLFETWCDYTDQSQSNMGSNWDIHLLGGRMNIQIIGCFARGYPRFKHVLLDGTRGVGLPEVNAAYPTDINAKGLDGITIVGFRSNGSSGIALLGPKPKPGLLHPGYQYKRGCKINAAGNPSDGDTVTIGSEVFTFKTTKAYRYEVQIGASAAASLVNLRAEWLIGKQAPYETLTLVNNNTLLEIYSTSTSPTAVSETSANLSVQLIGSGTAATQTETISDPAPYYDEGLGTTTDDGRDSLGCSDFILDDFVISVSHHSGYRMTDKGADRHTEPDTVHACLHIDGIGGSIFIHKFHIGAGRFESVEPFTVRLGLCGRGSIAFATFDSNLTAWLTTSGGAITSSDSWGKVSADRYNTCRVSMFTHDDPSSGFAYFPHRANGNRIDTNFIKTVNSFISETTAIIGKSVTVGDQNDGSEIGYVEVVAGEAGQSDVRLSGKGNSQFARIRGNPANGSMILSTKATGGSLTTRVEVTENSHRSYVPVRLPSYTVAGVPSASTSGAGSEIFVSNESGGAVTAFSDGTNWRRVTDRAVIS